LGLGLTGLFAVATACTTTTEVRSNDSDASTIHVGTNTDAGTDSGTGAAATDSVAACEAFYNAANALACSAEQTMDTADCAQLAGDACEAEYQAYFQCLADSNALGCGSDGTLGLTQDVCGTEIDALQSCSGGGCQTCVESSCATENTALNNASD